MLNVSAALTVLTDDTLSRRPSLVAEDTARLTRLAFGLDGDYGPFWRPTNADSLHCFSNLARNVQRDWHTAMIQRFLKMPWGRLELPILTEHDSESCAYTSSATTATISILFEFGRNFQRCGVLAIPADLPVHDHVGYFRLPLMLGFVDGGGYCLC